MAPRYLALKATPCRTIPGYRPCEFDHPESQERTLYVHPTDARALVEPTLDGHDYTRVCARHQWASHVVPYFADLGDCPECVAEIDSAAGRRRYAALHAERVRIVGTV